MFTVKNPALFIRCFSMISSSSSMQPLKILCVAEKNDAAKNISRILGQTTMREGRSKYNKLYCLTMNCRFGQNCPVVFTSVAGHLMNFEFDPMYKKWDELTIDCLFEARVMKMINAGMEPIDRTIKEQAKLAKILIIWTDCDREGENIGAEIVACAKQSNRDIQVYRAKFSEITPAAVRRAMNGLIPLDLKTVEAVDCRQELDLRIGAAFTRLQTLTLRKNFGNALNDIISYGSCQFPTLGFVVERFKAIQEFVSEPFWKLVGRHRRDGKTVDFQWFRVRLFLEEPVTIFRDLCIDAGFATVIGLDKKEKLRWRPMPLDTVELEKLAVRKLRMSAKTAMDIAERLYGKGYISYPRTETNIYPKDMELIPLVENLVQNQGWGAFAQSVLAQPHGPSPGLRGRMRKTDEAHPPIHPLKHVSKDDMEPRDWALYELVVRHFLACVSRDAKGQETKVTVDMGGEEFVATGLMIEDRGWLEVYPYDKWSDKELPIYTQGEQLKDFSVNIENGQTTPPDLLTEADLIALMDKHGIGTDATHSEHIEKIKTRQYVHLNPTLHFVPQNLGLALVDAYNLMGYEMSKPNLRANLEKQLKEIINGQRQKDDVLKEQIEKYRRIFRETERKINMLVDTFRRYSNNPPPGAGHGPHGGPGGGGDGPGGDDGGPDGPPNGPGRRPERNGVDGVPSNDRRLMAPPAVAKRLQKNQNYVSRPAIVDDAIIGIYTSVNPRSRKNNNAQRKKQPAGKNLRPPDLQPPPPLGQQHNPKADKLCTCNQKVIIQKVKKAGPNQGKLFLSCAKPMTDTTRCNHFEWYNS